MLARLQIGRRLQGKVDASDLVQEAFLEAYRDFGQFRRTTEQELAGWLRRILAWPIGYDLMADTWAAALQQVIAHPVQLTGYSADVISDKDPSARFARPFQAGTFAWFESGGLDEDGAQHND